MEELIEEAENELEEEGLIEIEDYETPLGLGLGFQEEALEELIEEAENAPEEEDLIEIEDYETPLGLENEPMAEMSVTIWSSKDAGTQAGDVITLDSSITGFDECSQVAYQWMCDRGDGYEAVSGANDSSYSYTADEDSVNWGWRLMVSYS